MSNAFAMFKAHSETVDSLLLKYSVADIKHEIALAQSELVLKPNCRREDCKNTSYYSKRHISKTVDTTGLCVISL